MGFFLGSLAPLDEFTDTYIYTALQSSNDDDGDPLSRHYDQSDIDPETLEQIRRDCERFQRENAAHIDSRAAVSRQPWAQAGHDFWLSRNRHGSGFKDSWMDPEGTLLHEAAKAFGEFDLYIGDDNKVYGSPLGSHKSAPAKLDPGAADPSTCFLPDHNGAPCKKKRGHRGMHDGRDSARGLDGLGRLWSR